MRCAGSSDAGIADAGGRARCIFFFSSRRRHTRCSRDWSSDVCSSDLYYQEEGEARLAPAKKKLDAAGIKYNARVLVGPIAETIVKQAKESGCDLIYIGTRGMSAASALLGSTANKVLNLSAVPVLLVK